MAAYPTLIVMRNTIHRATVLVMVCLAGCFGNSTVQKVNEGKLKDQDAITALEKEHDNLIDDGWMIALGGGPLDELALWQIESELDEIDAALRKLGKDPHQRQPLGEIARGKRSVTPTLTHGHGHNCP